ncbi:hypothetical protein Hz2V101 [Helicoverpa zea nudivirus 2]|uniref:Uncharacterized protein n=1 Tax=Helicoverpa zea nudivirus 2 TaxID=1128424 RepID=G9I0C7_HZNV2|nr:orf101 gene product [Helicoverpa zea nudivirus 2]AEW69650.1 hypothetical protein Hz2V101 [Helicoverpa zea nudivirus 2]
MKVISMNDYDILVQVDRVYDPKLVCEEVDSLVDLNSATKANDNIVVDTNGIETCLAESEFKAEQNNENKDSEPPLVNIDILKLILPKSLTMWLFTNKTKWYSIDSYKFGELTVTEDSLIDMIHNREIVAFAYAIYRTHEDEQGVWSDIKDSIRIIFGVVELVPNSMSSWLRTRYLPINEIESPKVYPDAPPFVLQSMHRPRIWLTAYENVKCSECGNRMYSLKGPGEPSFCCLDSECEQFKMCTVSLECIDFETGPLNDLKKSIKTRSRYCTEDVLDSVNQYNRSVAMLLHGSKKLKPGKISSGLGKSKVDSSSDSVINCIKCKNCKVCQRMLQTKQTRCARHPVCTHFMLKRRLM